jgi:hypothetical protein
MKVPDTGESNKAKSSRHFLACLDFDGRIVQLEKAISGKIGGGEGDFSFSRDY